MTRKVADEDVVHPANDHENYASSDGQAQPHESECSEHALCNAHEIGAPLQGKTEDDGGDHPADGVIDDGRRENYLADTSAHKIHFADHRRYNFHGSD